MTQVTRFAWPIAILGDELGYSTDETPEGDLPPTDWANASNGSSFEIAVQEVSAAPASDLNLAATVTNAANNTHNATNVGNVNDGDDFSAATFGSFVAGGATSRGFDSDLGSAALVSTMIVDWRLGGAANKPNIVEFSDDGSAYTSTSGVWSGGGGYLRVFTLNTPSSHRYWRVRSTGSAGFTSYINVYRWEITGSATIITAKGWEPAPSLNDGDDTTYHENSFSSNSIIRADLFAPREIGTMVMRHAAASNSSYTYTIEGTDDANFTTTTLLATQVVAESSAFGVQTTIFSWQPPEPFQFYQISVNAATARRFHTIEMYSAGGISSVSSNTLALGGVVVGNSASSNTHFVATSSTTGQWFPNHEYVRTTHGGLESISALGNLGSTESIDLTTANYFSGTLNADCTIGVTGATAGKLASWTVGLTEDGTGGWTPTFSGVTWIAGTPTHNTTAGTTTFYGFWTTDGGVTIFGFQAGSGSGGASSIALDDLTDVAITDPQESDTLRYRDGGWVNENGDLSASDLTPFGVRGELLITDTPAGSPLVFADLIQNEDGTELLYADLVEP